MFSRIMARLNRFEVYANQSIFNKIFGLNAYKLWHKFNCDCSNNSVQFFCALNFKNQSLLISYLERYTKDF
jgi:hypothetical protein